MPQKQHRLVVRRGSSFIPTKLQKKVCLLEDIMTRLKAIDQVDDKMIRESGASKWVKESLKKMVRRTSC